VLHALGGDQRLEVEASQRGHRVERGASHGAAVVAKLLDVDRGTERVNLRVVHAGADITPGHTHALRPARFQDLRAVEDEAVHADVLDPHRVPDQPRDRVGPGHRAAAHLRVGQLGDQIVGDEGMHGLVAEQPEIDGFHWAG
jgi:hypothetical protein